MADDSMIECPECQGTGDSYPECEWCGGEEVMSYAAWRRAGLTPREIANDLERDDCDDPDDRLNSTYYHCFADGHGTCVFCWGDCTIDAGFMQRQIDRVLLMARTGDVYPEISMTAWPGSWPDRVDLDYDAYLSMVAGNHCREHRWINWYRDIFGDTLSLTSAGVRQIAPMFDDGTARFLTVPIDG